MVISVPWFSNHSPYLEELLDMLAGFDKLTHLVLNTGLYTAHNVVGRLAARLPSLRYVRKDRALVIDRNEDGLYVGHHDASELNDIMSIASTVAWGHFYSARQ